MDQGTSALEQEGSEIIEVNPEQNEETWENLTEEEKSKMLEEYLKSN